MGHTSSHKHDDDGDHGAYDGVWYSHPPLRNALIAAGITALGFILMHAGFIPREVEVACYLLAIPIGGYHWVREGVEELIKEHEIGIEILMLAAAAGSIVLGLWEEAAFLVVLYAAAEGVEELTYARTRASIRGLLDLAPTSAIILENGEERTIPAEHLQVGDTFLVKPGARVPTDGVIVRGRSSLNEAAVTGESIPVEKEEGMPIYAATVNLTGALEVRATASFENNSLATIIHLVEEAQEQKGRTQVFIERFGRVYSPLVLLASLLLIVVPPLLGMPFDALAVRGVVLLIAAAPCALVMSTPIAIAAGIGSAGAHGILIKGGAHLENLGKIRAIALDKTGTLTTGTPVVTDIIPLEGSEADLLRLAYSVERGSEHPLATAIIRRAQEAGIEALEARGLCTLTGQGAAAVIGGTRYMVGRPESFPAAGQDPEMVEQFRKLRIEGKTVMVVGTEETPIGIIAVRDQVRPEAKGMVDRLRSMGTPVVMLTGDNAVTARAFAAHLGIDDVQADLRPEEKIRAIEGLKERYGAVAMVGDGINDAPALASATVGIAMGTIGTDAAIEAADVALMADDLAKVPEAIAFGRKAVGVGNQNIVFSLLVLAVMIPAALLGVLSVAVAVILHEASELMAVGNGLRVVKR